MMKLLEPIVQLVGRMSFRTKLRATALLFGIPLLLMTLSLLVEYDSRVSRLKVERETLSIQVQTLALLGNLYQLSAAQQGLEEGYVDLASVAEVKRVKAIESANQLESLRQVLSSNENSYRWLSDLEALKDQISSADIEGTQLLISEIRTDLDHLNEISGLLSDGDADSARLLDVVTTHLPGLVETTGKAAQVGTVVLAKQSIRGSRRNELTLYRGNFDSLVLWSLDGIRKVGQSNLNVQSELEGAASQLNTAYASMQEAITIKMLDTTDFSMLPDHYLVVAERAMDETLSVGTLIAKSTDTLLADRLFLLLIKRNFVFVLILFGAMLVGAGFSAAYISIMRGLKGLSDAVGTMAMGNLDARVDVTSKDELGDVGQRFNEMAEKLALRTSELADKTHHIHGMLQNLPQGVMTITQGLFIHPEYSEYLKSILETKAIGGLPALELVCEGAQVGSDAMAQQYATLSACLGEDKMNFDFNAHLLLKEIRKTMPDGRTKILELLWAPICDGENTVEKIMLSVRDVTQLRELEAEATLKKRELEIIGQILKIEQTKFVEFSESSRDFIAQNRKLLSNTQQFNPELITQLFRNMHTIKGNARTYGFLYMTNVVHEAEQSYDDLRNSVNASFEPHKLLLQLTEVEQSIDEYVHISEQVLGRKKSIAQGGSEKYLTIEYAAFESIMQQLNAYDVSACRQETLAALVSDLRHELSLIGTSKIQNALAGVFDSLPSLAKELGKLAPVISVNEHGIVVKNQITDLLRNVFMHLFRNSIDHGIEQPETRLAQGKSAAGNIFLDLSLTQNALVFDLHDDGQGLALCFIREKAIERGLIPIGGLLSDKQIANLIFAPGFSTASKVTEVSGRGVGMDAVQAFVKREGGAIELILNGGGEGDFYRPFITRISLPSTCAHQSIRPSTANDRLHHPLIDSAANSIGGHKADFGNDLVLQGT